METLGILLQIWMFVLTILAACAFGLAIQNYTEARLHRRGIAKLIEMVTELELKQATQKMADQINDMIFGNDRPEDLEKAIKETAEKEGLTVDSIIVKGRRKPAEKTAKKGVKKTTKKTTKKENK